MPPDKFLSQRMCLWLNDARHGDYARENKTESDSRSTSHARNHARKLNKKFL